AIGHEKDSPLLDQVADLRASTPTDAGKRIVPDAALESGCLLAWRQAAAAALETFVSRQRVGLASFRTRPVVAQPARMLDPHRARLAGLHAASGAALVGIMTRAEAAAETLAAALRALSPQATLDRGY